MASVQDCIEKMATAGTVSRALADEALEFYKRSQKEFSMETGPASADAAAAVETAKKMRDKAAANQIQIAATVKAFQAGEKRIVEDPRGRQAALMGMLSKDVLNGDSRLDALRKSDPTHPIFTGGNADYRAAVVKDKLFSMLGPELDKLKTGFLTDIKKMTSSANFIRERFGVATGDAVAKSVSDGFGKVIDYGSARAKAAGKVFTELEDWRVFQHWQPSRVAQFSPDEYVKDYMAQIANGGLKLFDKETGRYATASKYDEILRKAHSDIKTEGGATSPFSKDVRTFEFQPGEAGAKSWLALQAKYGVGNEIMATVSEHMEHMARSVALYEQFGGNPDAVFSALLRQVKDDPSAPVKGMGFLSSPRMLKLTYDTISGKGSPVANETAARIMAGARDVVGMASLRNLPGSIIPGDAAMTFMASNHLGMDGFKVLGEVLNSGLSKDEARHLLVSSHGYMDFTNNAVRKYEDQINVSGLIRKVSRGVVRATGAELWTTNGRQGWQASMLAQLASMSGKSFDKLPDKLRGRFFERRGFTSADWDTIRQAQPLITDGGAKYIDPNANGALGERLMMAIKEEGSYAFHQPDARTQAFMRQGQSAGSPTGELWLSLGQYKQFTMERMSTHLMRIMVDGPMGNRIARGLAFTALSMAAGAVSLQAAAIVAGKTPMDMANPKFWLQSWVKGGAGGLYGDLLNAALFGGRDAPSTLGQLAGPVPGFALDVGNMAFSPLKQEIDPHGNATAQETFANQAFAMGRRWTPSTWFTKLAVDRLFWDKLQVLTDKNYRASFQRLDTRAQKQGQGWLWKPGQSAPAFMQ